MSLIDVRKLIYWLIISFPDFANVGFFLVFIFLLFSSWGVQEYSGVVYNTCRLSPEPDFTRDTWESNLTYNRPCSIKSDGNFVCQNNETCGNID